jgi:hypothetical protein
MIFVVCLIWAVGFASFTVFFFSNNWATQQQQGFLDIGFYLYLCAVVMQLASYIIARVFTDRMNKAQLVADLLEGDESEEEETL